ncbi:MAG: hypothetical protein M5R36_07440 [Deltaproteobacteria bacterium]|nr:hypothetical protein [Deltaproteobacteria bacterium]
MVLAFLIAGFTFFAGCSCGDDDDDDDSGDDDTLPVDDDDDLDDDETDDDTVPDWPDDDTGDDDTGDDDTGDDDTGDDDTVDDLFVADWPQSNIETQDYDENPSAGTMRLKAEDYDQFHLDWHQPYYGSTVGIVVFTDANRDTVSSYGDFGDSCIWTGTYATSQAFRYYVTGEQEAKDNAIRAVTSLDRHLHVTGRPGFIARYVAPQDAPEMYEAFGGDTWCEGHHSCHHIESGDYAGDWWDGNTSRDQYTGWFLGMATVYDLVDDAPTRAMIAANVAEVLDELIANYWWIIDVDGQPTGAAPNVLPPQQLNWALIGYHLTGEDRFKAEVQKWIADDKRDYLRLMNITIMNRYGDYYGNNLGHQNFYSLLRLGKVYLGADDYAFLLDMFDTQTHSHTRLSHNAFFNAIHMSQGIYTPSKDEYQDQLEEDLGDFRDAPNTSYAVDPDDTALDPVSVFLHDLIVQYPFLGDLFGNIEPQTLDAHPVLQQCSTDFLWQRNPYRFEPCGTDNEAVTRPGVDYLVAYWMAAYHKFIDKAD